MAKLRDELYFLWFSDIHFDPHYATTKGYSGEGICNSTSLPSIGKYGCDSPEALIRSAFDAAVKVVADAPTKPSFIIVTGDSVRHGMDLLFMNHTKIHDDYVSQAHELVNSPHYSEAMDAAGQIVSILYSILNEYFPDTEIIVSVGNNDVVPDYYLELKEESTPLGNSSLKVEDAGMLGVLYNALSNNNIKGKRAILTQDDEWTFLRGGYYSKDTLHNGNLIILSLNTVLYSSNLIPEPMNAKDPGKQFEWMRKMMKYSRERQCQVIIVGHIPPTIGSYRHNKFWKDGYVKTYYDLIEEFNDVVIAQLFGHLHSDEFRVGDMSSAFVNANSKTQMIPDLSSPLLLGPSVTPLHGNNPAFRVVKYGLDDGNKGYSEGAFKLLDYDSYNFLVDTDSEWTKLYTFSEVYSSSYDIKEGLSSNTMRSIVESMEDTINRQESPILKSFRSFILSGADGKSQFAGLHMDCNEECKDDWLCTIKSATREGYDNCLIYRRESRNEANNIILIALAGVVISLVALVFMVRRCKASKRFHYEDTPSVEGEANGMSLEIDKL